MSKTFKYIFYILLAVAILCFLLTKCGTQLGIKKPTPTPITQTPTQPGEAYKAPADAPNPADYENATPGGTGAVNNGAIVDDGTIDDRASDPNLLATDELFLKGDEGVETRLGVQALETLRRTYPNPAIKAQGGDLANNVIAFGSLFFGTPYEYGSNRSNPKTFDCSDFTRWAYLGALGMDLPKDSRAQGRYVDQFSGHKFTDIYQAKKGDLLFFMSYRGYKESDYKGINVAAQTITHVGIYMGNGKMLHTASQATGGVRIDNIFGKHYQYRFIKGGSVL